MSPLAQKCQDTGRGPAHILRAKTGVPGTLSPELPYLEMVRAVPTGTSWLPSRQEELAGKCDSLQRAVKIPKELCAPAASPFQSEPGFFLNKKLPIIVHSEATPNRLVHLAGHL